MWERRWWARTGQRVGWVAESEGGSGAVEETGSVLEDGAKAEASPAEDLHGLGGLFPETLNPRAPILLGKLRGSPVVDLHDLEEGEAQPHHGGVEAQRNVGSFRTEDRAVTKGHAGVMGWG